MIIAVDFDGTCVAHEFPKVGKDIGAVPILKKLVKNGHQIILHTMRGDQDSPEGGNYLQDAVDWFEMNDIPLIGVNHNPGQSLWTNSPKIYAHHYIDDAAVGCPLKYDLELSPRPFIDWEEMDKVLQSLNLFI